MIVFSKHRYPNGITLLHHHDAMTRMVAVNLLYDVGSRDESPERTGLAHLMEHLMFGGSLHAPSFDSLMQQAGGVNNAWTNADTTNYYDVIPAHNLETALWLESDRLGFLSLSDEAVNVQKKVVIEEFKQRYLNQPYGDMSHLIHALAYTVHPYRWPTIGLDIKQIEEVTPGEVIDFYRRHYSTRNLVICLSGNIEFPRAVELVDKWFGNLTPRDVGRRQLPAEPLQTEPRQLEVTRNVPQDMILQGYRMARRADRAYVAADIISDILSYGKSSRFYVNLMSKSDLFTGVDASVGGSLDEGLFYVRAMLAPGADIGAAREAVENELNRLVSDGVSDYELEKFVNKHQSASMFDRVGCLSIATNLCAYEQIGDASLINTENAVYRQMTPSDIQTEAKRLFAPENCSTLLYRKEA